MKHTQDYQSAIWKFSTGVEKMRAIEHCMAKVPIYYPHVVLVGTPRWLYGEADEWAVANLGPNGVYEGSTDYSNLLILDFHCRWARMRRSVAFKKVSDAIYFKMMVPEQ